MSLFTIKSKATRGSLLSTGCFIAFYKINDRGCRLVYSSPNSRREYRFESRANPTPTPTGSSFASFLSRKEEKIASYSFPKLTHITISMVCSLPSPKSST
jgi:hypothetical protein